MGEAPEAGIELAKLSGVEPRAFLREAAMRPVRNPGAVTLARDLKPPESRARRSGDRLSAANLARIGRGFAAHRQELRCHVENKMMRSAVEVPISIHAEIHRGYTQ